MEKEVGACVMVFVDALHVYHNAWGPFLRGSCHMFAFLEHTEALHAMAKRIGLKREWFQPDRDGGHYDLTGPKREHAVRLGAIQLGRYATVTVWRTNRQKLATRRTDIGSPAPGDRR